MKTLFTLSLAFMLFSLNAQETPFFTDQPALSPDGSQLVFAYNSDLWRVATNGGNAQRITALDGQESYPRISPDGKWLAFSSAQKGNSDVYLMPLGGGEIKQLTFHAAPDQVANWSWDSQKIYFKSGRYNRGTTFTVDINGGTPKRLFKHYFNTIHNVAEDAKTGQLWFNESWESDFFANRQGYKGPFNPDIKSFDLKKGTVTQHTDYEGKDLWPMTTRDGRTYFVSDRENGAYNLYQLDDKKTKRLTRFKRSVFSPTVSADGSKIAFIRDYQIHVYDTKSGKTSTPAIDCSSYANLGQVADFSTDGNISYFDVARDGKKLAFVSRGELFVSDISGKFIRQLDTGSDRVMEVKWLKDDKTLIFTQTFGGYQNLFSMPADGSGKPTQHTRDARNNRLLEMAADTSKLAYFSGRDEVRMLDLVTFTSTTLAKDELWGLQNSLPRWSPDGRYLMYTAYANFERDIKVIDTKQNNRVINLTNTGVTENEAVWSPDGKYIYFVSARHQPNYPRGGGDVRLFRMPLQKLTAPFRQEKFDALFAEKEDQKGKKDSIVVNFNLEGIMDRLEPIGPRAGNQSGPFVLQDGDKTTVVYGSDHTGQFGFFKTVMEPFEETKTEQIKGRGVSNATDLVTVKGKHYLIGLGKIQEVNLGGNKLKPIEIKHTFRRALGPEFQQMFYETWANVEENFYNEDFHGVDWPGLRDRYAAFLPHLTNRADLRRMTNDLLGELNTSHSGFSSNGAEERTRARLTSAATGLEFSQENPYTIQSIIADGPADRDDLDIEAGDQIVAINGLRVDPAQNREYYFTLPSLDKEMALTLVQGSGEKERTVRIHPEPFFQERNHRYDTWVDDNQALVDEKTDKRVAYVHMKNMTGGELNNFLDEMVSESYNRDALILDLRYNTGGNVHDAVLQFLSQRPYAKWTYRGGTPSSQPNFAPQAKPVILLINQQSLSDAEVTAEGFKALGLGTIVGTPTYRWIIFTSGKGLVDGSFYRLPSWGVYGLDGRNLEKTGVEPDIRIDNTAADRQAGRDPQLERAIEEALKDL